MLFTYGSVHVDMQVLAGQRGSLQQLCADTECSLEELPEAMYNKDEWWERERESANSC